MDQQIPTFPPPAEFAAQAGVPHVLAPQTIGPFGTRRGRLLARRNLARATAVFARDPLSADAAARCSVFATCRSTPASAPS